MTSGQRNDIVGAAQFERRGDAAGLYSNPFCDSSVGTEMKGQTGWDRKGVHAAFSRFLLEESGSNGIPAIPKSGKAIVGGCGTGYDVALLAKWGLDVLGVDSSAGAVSAARRHLDETLSDDQDARQRAAVAQDDFFAIEAPRGGFDVMYDYTFLCALPPNLRSLWSETYARLSRPGTILIMLQFPVVKDDGPDRPANPPFPLTQATLDSLLDKNWHPIWLRWVTREESPFKQDEPFDYGAERIAVFVKK